MIASANQDKTKPDAVAFLRKVLIKHNILDRYGVRKKFKICNKEAFRKIFKAFFIIWLYNNFNFRNQSNFCFVKLNRKNTLLLLPPKKIITAYLNQNNKSFFKNSIFEGIESENQKNTKHCIVQNFINFNLRQFGKKELTTNHKRSCGPCFRNFSKKLSKEIIKDVTNPGFALGGFPFLINDVPSNLIKELIKTSLAEASTKSEINESLSSFLLALVCIYVNDKKKFGGGRTNCVMTQKVTGSIQKTIIGPIKVCTNEIDAIIYSQQKKVLIAIELTSLNERAFRRSWENKEEDQFTYHFKKTLNNFNFLKTYAESKHFEFKELYLTLEKFSSDMKKLPHYHTLNRSPRLEHKNLKIVFDKLKAEAERDSISHMRINSAFLRFLKIINKL